MIFVGGDWAEEHHEVHVMDETGRRLAARRLPEELAGIRDLHELLAAHAEDSGQVVVGIETDLGQWVDALVDRLPAPVHRSSARRREHGFALVLAQLCYLRLA